MALPTIDLTGVRIPTADGEANTYVHPEAKASRFFDSGRTVFFINGMLNTGADHATSALALSWVQMCAVRGIHNMSVSGWSDFTQCVADKNQFNGASLSAHHAIGIRELVLDQTSAEAARNALRRNPAQVTAFDELRAPGSRDREIFAHSQGNLILSNALQAIAAVDGATAVLGRRVNTFGSPTVHWPLGIDKVECGFTFDPVNWLSGFDSTWSISKVGMPDTSRNPITHAFLQYLQSDPAFVVNRFRWGGLGVTFSMDEDGLAKCLVDMGLNLRRVWAVFDYLRVNNPSDSDDVALAYVGLIRNKPSLIRALKGFPMLRDLLVRLLGAGWTSSEEQAAIDFLKAV